jgi:hypothetical protein
MAIYSGKTSPESVDRVDEDRANFNADSSNYSAGNGVPVALSIMESPRGKAKNFKYSRKYVVIDCSTNLVRVLSDWRRGCCIARANVLFFYLRLAHFFRSKSSVFFLEFDSQSSDLSVQVKFT